VNLRYTKSESDSIVPFGQPELSLSVMQGGGEASESAGRSADEALELAGHGGKIREAMT
jgi:hypothetical protein